MSRPHGNGPRFAVYPPDRIGVREVRDLATGERMLVYRAVTGVHRDHIAGHWYFRLWYCNPWATPTSNGYPTRADAIDALITSQEAIHARLA